MFSICAEGAVMRAFSFLLVLFAITPLVTAGPYLPEPDELARNVSIEEQKFELGGLDNPLVIKVKLKNRASFSIKDFVIGCVAVAPSGTVIGTPKTTLYQSLAAGQAKVFPDIAVGLVNSQVAKAGCSVISASRNE